MILDSTHTLILRNALPSRMAAPAKQHGQQSARLERQRYFAGKIVEKSIVRQAAVSEDEALGIAASMGLSSRQAHEYLTDLILSGFLVRVRLGATWAYWDSRTMPAGDQVEARKAEAERATEAL